MQESNTTPASAALPTGQMIEVIRQFITERYQPTDSPTDAHIMMHTQGIFSMLQLIMPGSYSAEDVRMLLLDMGYKMFELGELRYEWMLRKI
jgi:hypothetical protein